MEDNSTTTGLETQREIQWKTPWETRFLGPRVRNGSRVEGNKANKNRKGIYVTVRVNPHVPGPMEARKKARRCANRKVFLKNRSQNPTHGIPASTLRS